MNARAAGEWVDERTQVADLLSTAKAADLGDRRLAERHPFFYPVNVASQRPGSPSFSAFSRDISAGGMGLLHNMPLERGPVVLTIMSDAESPVRLAGIIMWCVPCGEGWYTSGVRFDHHPA